MSLKDSEASSPDSWTMEEGTRNILPAGKLKVDDSLQLSRINFGQSIKQILQKQGKVRFTTSEYLFDAPPFPAPGVLAKFASLVYRDKDKNEYERDFEKRLQLPDGWKLLTTAFNNKATNGYIGAAYWHSQRNYVVIAHRGTQPSNLGSVWTDLVGILFEKLVPQMYSASTFAHTVIQVLIELEKKLGIKFHLFFTGHSLGGWLAQITTFTTEYLETVDKNFRRRKNTSVQHYHSHTVVFDSPGCKEMLRKIEEKFDVRHEGHSISLDSLDITTYLSTPNRVNTCNTHIGTVYRIFTDLTKMGTLVKHTAAYTQYMHSMDKILEAFDPVTGQVAVDSTGRLKLHTVVDWPRCDGITRGEEYKDFFKWAEYLNNYHPEPTDEKFKREISKKGCFPIRYQTKKFEPTMTNANVFTRKEKEFLQIYQGLRQNKLTDFYDFFDEGTEENTKKRVRKKLETFIIENDNIFHCTTAEELQAIIPFVKRLVYYFITEDSHKRSSAELVAAKKLYKTMTGNYLSELEHQILDFNGHYAHLEDFLNGDDLQMWHLQSKRPSWAELKRIYRCLQKKGIITTDHQNPHCTAMELKQIIQVNELINFKMILDSDKHPNFLLVDCNTTRMSYKAQKFFEELFSTVNIYSHFKVIIITQEDDEYEELFRRYSIQLRGKFSATKSEEFTWSQLTLKSKEDLWETKVEFQGEGTPFSQLIDNDDEEFLENLYPRIFMEKDALLIGNKISTSSGYNEFYYIERSFDLRTIITENIISDIANGKFKDVVVHTEEEFIRICAENKSEKYSVHLLEKSSENLLWKKSHGDISSLRSYVDVGSILDVTEEEIIYKKSQRILIIVGGPGMGKTTVLDHLSTLAKKEFPSFWIVRLNLNDYTKQLKEKKEFFSNGPSIHEVIAFISSDLLNLRNPLEIAYFKNAILKTGKMWILFDGFDEISPAFTETVLAIIKILKESEVQKLVITTRLHLRDYLENALQQFSFSLKAFEAQHQIKFLTKYWQQKLENGTEERLAEYSKSLIEAVTKPIKDKERKLIGIPLLTRMLAEIHIESAKRVLDGEQSITEISETFSLIWLFDSFVEKKFEIFKMEKSKFEIGNQGAEELFQDFRKKFLEEHQTLALRVLFTEDQLSLLQPVGTISDIQKLARFGILEMLNSKAFIHRTFAEYFAASYFALNMFHYKKPSKQQSEFLFKVVLVSRENETLRVFLDAMLEKRIIPENTITECSSHILELWSENKIFSKAEGDTCLHVACQNGLLTIVNFLLSCLEKDPLLLKEFLLAKNRNNNLALHYASSNANTEIPLRMLRSIKDNIDSESKKQIIRWKDACERNIVHNAMLIKNCDTVAQISVLVYLAKNFDTESVKEMILEKDNFGYNILHHFINHKDWKSVMELLNYVKENFDNETGQQIIIGDNGFGKDILIFVAIIKEWDSVMELIFFLTSTFDSEFVKQIFLQKNNFGENIVLYFLENKNQDLVMKLMTYLINEFGTDFVKQILSKKTVFGENILFHFGKNKDWVSIMKLLEYLNSNFDSGSVLQMILEQNIFGEHMLFYVVENKDWKEVMELLSYIVKNFEFHSAKQIFLEKNKFGNSILLHAAKNKDWDSCMELFSFLINNFDDDYVKEIFIEKNNFGESIFFYVLENKNWEFVIELLNYLVKNLNTESVEQIFLEKTNFGTHFLLFVLENKNRVLFMELLSFLTNNFDSEFVKQILLEQNKFGYNILQYVVENKDWKSSMELLSHLRNNFDIESLKQIFLDKNIFGKNILRYAIVNKDWKSVMELLIFIKDNFDTEFKKEIFIGKKGSGKNIILYVIESMDWMSVKELLTHMKSTFDLESRNQIFLEKDVNGRTILACAVANKNCELIELLAYLQENVNNESMKEMIIEKDSSGRNIIQHALLIKNWKSAVAMLNHFRKRQDIGSFKQLILEKNNYQRNILYDTMVHITLYSCTPCIDTVTTIFDVETVKSLRENSEELYYLSEFLNFCIYNFETSELTDLIIVKNGLYYISLHFAARQGLVGTVKFLLENGADVFEGNCRDSVLHQAVAGNNIEILQLILYDIRRKSIENPGMLSNAVNFPDNDGDTPIMWAIEEGKIDAVRLLLEFDVDITIQNSKGMKALHWAVRTREFEISAELLKHGADVNDLNSDDYALLVNSQTVDNELLKNWKESP